MNRKSNRTVVASMLPFTTKLQLADQRDILVCRQILEVHGTDVLPPYDRAKEIADSLGLAFEPAIWLRWAKQYGALTGRRVPFQDVSH